MPETTLSTIMQRFYVAQLRCRMVEVGFPLNIARNAELYANYNVSLAARVFPPIRKRLDRYWYAVVQADADWQDYLAIQLGVLRD